MRTAALLPIVALLVACAGEPETIRIRLADEFDPSMVQGSPPAEEIEPFEWRFDGEGTIEPENGGATVGWSALRDVTGLAVEDGSLVGTSGAIGVIRATRTDDVDEDDLLYGIEVRMRVSEGSELGVNFTAAQELGGEQLDGQRDRWSEQARPMLRADLTPGEEVQTYLLREAGATIRISAVRNLFVRPTDAEGADFAIESVRIIPLKEHLASIPSGLGWQGLAEIYRETIVARTPERIVADVRLPESPWLDVAFGTIEDGPVTFRLSVTAGGTERSLLRRTVTRPDRWTSLRVDLSAWAGQDVSLSFGLDGDDPGMIGYWGSPVVHAGGAMPVNDWVTEDREALDDGGTRRPKAVIVYLLDTLRRDHLPMWGYERETAPTLSRIAEEGVLFEDNIAQGAWTKVSVPSLLTSLYPTTHGITDQPDRLPSSVTTMAEAFRAAGYATWQSSSVPFSGKLTNLQQGVDVLHERTSVTDVDLPEKYTSKTARTFVDRLLEYAGDHRDVPFFAFVHTFDPHSPFEPFAPYDGIWATADGKAEYERGMEITEGYLDDLPTKAQLDSTDIDQALFVQHERDWYDGSIRGLDEEIERLMEGLEELGIADETLFIFLADHGEEFLEHGMPFHGNSVYGDQVNVPLIMHWPGVLPGGVRVTRTTENVDMMPTVLELAGIEPPEAAQGQSLLSAILDPDGDTGFGAIQRAAFSERVPVPAFPGIGLKHSQSSIVLDGWKLVKNVDQPEDWSEYELYDHHADPLNLHDVASEHPDIVERLAGELETWHEYALSLRPPPDTEAVQGLSPEEIARLRSLGYINN